MLTSPELSKVLSNEGAETETMTPQQFGDLMRRKRSAGPRSRTRQIFRSISAKAVNAFGTIERLAPKHPGVSPRQREVMGPAGGLWPWHSPTGNSGYSGQAGRLRSGAGRDATSGLKRIWVSSFDPFSSRHRIRRILGSGACSRQPAHSLSIDCARGGALRRSTENETDIQATGHPCGRDDAHYPLSAETPCRDGSAFNPVQISAPRTSTKSEMVGILC